MDRSPIVVAIRNADLTAEISDLGAELVRLRDGAGRDYLWNGDPVYWKGKAPLLFPMVGRAAGDHIKVEGRLYPMSQHGFARTSRFQIVEAAESHCTMALSANSATLAQYPFRFRLEATYRIVGRALSVVVNLFNDGEEDVPASFGFHPAFCWPMPGAGEKRGHALIFDCAEPAPIRRLDGGLLIEEAMPSPLEGRRLELSAALFEHDALVFDRLESRGVDYVGPQGQKLRIAFPDMPHLGVWTKPGAEFVCIEPWQGFASPVGFDGEFADRPGVILVAPGSCRGFEISIEIPV